MLILVEKKILNILSEVRGGAGRSTTTKWKSCLRFRSFNIVYKSAVQTENKCLIITLQHIRIKWLPASFFGGDFSNQIGQKMSKPAKTLLYTVLFWKPWWHEVMLLIAQHAKDQITKSHCSKNDSFTVFWLILSIFLQYLYRKTCPSTSKLI